MTERWYVMEMAGPYGWRVAQRTTGPYYNETEWFRARGYETEEDALDAISAYLDENVYSGPFFVLKGYDK